MVLRANKVLYCTIWLPCLRKLFFSYDITKSSSSLSLLQSPLLLLLLSDSYAAAAAATAAIFRVTIYILDLTLIFVMQINLNSTIAHSKNNASKSISYRRPCLTIAIAQHVDIDTYYSVYYWLYSLFALSAVSYIIHLL
jgi:hypothetical protein